LLPDGTSFEIPLPGSTFGLGAKFSIPAGEMSNPLRASMKWNDTQIESAPDPAAAR
jgi:hypothetical protein